MKPFWPLLVILISSICPFQAAFGFLGAERCGACHAKAYEAWRQGSHAQATRTLPGGKRRTVRCLSCHTTDGRQRGADFRVEGVQCEACHGAGEHYAFDDVMRDRRFAANNGLVKQAQEVCQSCHMVGASPALKPIDYKRALELIRHW